MKTIKNFTLKEAWYGQGLIITVKRDGFRFTYDHDKLMEKNANKLLTLRSWVEEGRLSNTYGIPSWLRYTNKYIAV